MLRRISLGAMIISFAFAAGAASIVFAEEATSTDEGSQSITFPIPELGNCASKNECRIYCSDLSHADACLGYAEVHGLMKKEETDRARTIITTVGPGSCTSRDECKAYCAIDTNREECMKFAEEHGLQAPRLVKNGNTPVQLRGKIDLLLASSTGPGGCTSVSECKTFCADSAHAEECLAFAEAHDLMTRAETDHARDVLQREGPGGCKGIECKEYCEEHRDECIAFAKEHGLITQDKARAITDILKDGGPGGCTTVEECRSYCTDAAHADECTAFAQSHSLIQQREEKEGARATTSRPLPPLQKIGNSTVQIVNGPGGCNSPQSCVEYCKSHLEECKNFRPTPTSVTPPKPQEILRPTSTSGSLQLRAIPNTQFSPDMPIEQRCALAGGVWDGARCVKPIQQNAPQSYVASPFLAAVASLFTPIFR